MVALLAQTMAASLHLDAAVYAALIMAIAAGVGSLRRLAHPPRIDPLTLSVPSPSLLLPVFSYAQ